MNKKTGSVFLMLAVILAGVGIFYQKQSAAQPAQSPKVAAANLAGVIPFSTTGGMVGFFNPSDGTVYLYDSELNNCLMISRISKLGEPMEKIR